MNRAAPLPAFPTNEVAVAEAKRRLSVAKRLDKLVHSRSKERAEAEWRRVNAAEIGVELDSDEDDDAAVMTFDAAGKIAKVKAKERARRIARGEDGDEVNAADDDDSESDGMNDLRVAGMDVDDQTSHAKFGERLRADREEARLRRELESMLETSLGTNAARRQGIGSAKYPSRGDGGAKLAAAAAAKSEKRARGGGGRRRRRRRRRRVRGRDRGADAQGREAQRGGGERRRAGGRRGEAQEEEAQARRRRQVIDSIR